MGTGSSKRLVRAGAAGLLSGLLVLSACATDGGYSLGFRWNPPTPRSAIRKQAYEEKFNPVLDQLAEFENTDKELSRETRFMNFRGKCVVKIELLGFVQVVPDSDLNSVLGPAGFEEVHGGTLPSGLDARYARQKSGDRALFEYNWQRGGTMAIMMRQPNSACPAR